MIIHLDEGKKQYIHDSPKFEDEGNFRMNHLSIINLKSSIGVYEVWFEGSFMCLNVHNQIK